MERFITFCVLIFHSSLVASIPFPEEYNLAYQQPHLQYPAQPQPQIEPSGQQYNNYGNYENFQPPSPVYGNAPSYQNLYYPSHPNFVNRESALQQHQAYNYFLPRQPTVQNFHTLSQSYLNPTPLNNGYNKDSPIYVPQEQQVPLGNSPTKQFFSGQPQGNDKIAAALSAAQRQVKAAQAEADKLQAQALQNQASTSSPQLVNPYQQIYQHVANNILTDQSPQPIQWRNLWKQYSDESAPPKPKKRYLVIHPDGTTEYVDHLETIAKKHPNYLLVNGGSIVPQSITSSSPNEAAIPPIPASQANKISSEPLSQDNGKAQDSSLEDQIIPKSDTNNQIPSNTATLTKNVSDEPDTDSDPGKDIYDSSVPRDSDSQPTPETTNSGTLPQNPLTQASKPDPEAEVSNQNRSPSADEKPSDASQPSDDSTIPENSLPSLENPSETDQNLEKNDSQQTAESSVSKKPAAETPANKEDSAKQTESKPVTPSIQPTFVVPEDKDDVLDLSKLNTAKPPTIFLTSDSDILRELLGDDEISVVYFFQIKPKAVAENDAKTIADSNDTATVETN